MQANVFPREPKIRPAENPAADRHRPMFTPDEFQQLGMFRIAYLTGARSSEGVKVTIHGADGMAVAVADTIAHAVDLANQLGLALVAVH